jgi:hypothetical protein
MPNLTLVNTQIPTIPIIVRDADGAVVPIPEGDTFYAASSDDALIRAEIVAGPAVRITPLTPTADNIAVAVADSAGLTPVTLMVTVNDMVDPIPPDPAAVSIDLDMANITYESQPRPPDGGTPPEPSPTGSYVAEVALAEASFFFDMADGTDIGSFAAPDAGFVQGCIRCRHADLPDFFVDFRQDVDSDRIDVVFWNGQSLGEVPSAYARDLEGYIATIRDGDGAVVHEEIVPQHYWGQRWRWQSAPRPIIRTAEEVFADGWLPHMSRAAARIEGINGSTGQPWSGQPYAGVIVPPVPAAVGTYTTFMPQDDPVAMTKLGLNCAVDSGGERAEIGLVTEWQADWLLRGTDTSLDALMEQAEMCAGDWNFYIPDSVTGAPVDYKSDDAHYLAHEYQQQEYGAPKFYQIKWGRMNGWDIHEADSHIPSVFYLPYALTNDPYYLEAMQFIVQYGVGWTIYQRETIFADLGTRVVCSYTNEIRTLGWGIRNLACAFRGTPPDVPAWLQPRSYFEAVSADYLLVIDTLFTKNPDPLHAMFRQLGSDPYYQIFEQSYAIMGMALADLVGLPGDWLTQLEFYFGMHAAICDPASGWNYQCPQPHDLDSAGLGVNSKQSWAEWWEACRPLMQQGATFPDAEHPGNQQGGSMGNCSQVYAACACALSRGVPEAGPAKAWMDEFVDHNYPNNADNSMGIGFYAKCGFDGT